MAIEVNEELTRRVAALARLALTDDEVKEFTPQLKDILEYIERIQGLNVEGVAPLNHPLDLETPLRKDEVRDPPRNSQDRPKVLDAAPEVVEDGFKVPQVI